MTTIISQPCRQIRSIFMISQPCRQIRSNQRLGLVRSTVEATLGKVIIRFCFDRCKAPARTLRLASWRTQSRSTGNSFEFGNDRDQSCKRCGHSGVCRTRPLVLTLLPLGADGPPPHIFSVLRDWSRFLQNESSATKTPCTTELSTKKEVNRIRHHRPDHSRPGQKCPQSRARVSPH